MELERVILNNISQTQKDKCGICLYEDISCEFSDNQAFLQKLTASFHC